MDLAWVDATIDLTRRPFGLTQRRKERKEELNQVRRFSASLREIVFRVSA